MANNHLTLQEAIIEIEELRSQLEEAEDTIRAIKSGEVDAVVVSGPEGEKIYTLTGAEHTYRILVEAMNEGALVLSPNGSISYSNRTFAAMLGYAVYDVLGHFIYEYVSDADAELLKQMLEQAPLHATRREIQLKSSDAESVPASVSVGNLETDGNASISAVITDLTEHNRTEAELSQYREHLEELVEVRTTELAHVNLQLAESERRVVSILESISDGFWAHDKDWHFVYINAEAERQIKMIAGRSKDDILGKVLWDEFPFLIGTQIHAQYCRAMEDQKSAKFQQFFENIDKWFEFRMFPSEAGLSVYLEDITERKWAESQILQQNALVEGINRIFHEVLSNKTEEELGSTCLSVAEELTKSKFGFIGEIDSEGYYSDIAVSDPGWKACKVIDPTTGKKWLPSNLKIHGVYGSVMLDGKGFFTNDPPSHPDSIGVPEGHPELTAFLGVPLIYEGKVIGMLGLGNRDDGYCDVELELIEDLVPAIVEAFKRKRAEKERDQLLLQLNERNADLTAVFSAIQDTVVIYDTNMNVKQVNPAFQSTYGFNPVGLNVRDVITQTNCRWLDGRPMNFDDQPTPRAISGETVQNQRLLITLPDGSEMALETSSAPLFLDNNVLGAVTVWHNVTERKRVEDALRDSQKQLSIILDSIADGFYAFNREWKFTHINDEALRYFGKKREEMIGRTLYEFFQGFDGSIFEREFGHAMETAKPTVFETPSIFTDRTVEMHAYPGADSMTVLFRDITERKQAQEALRVSEERFRLALEHSPVSVAVQDATLVYQWAYNQRSRQSDEIIGKTDADLFAPEDLPVILEAKHRVLEFGIAAHDQHWVTSNGRRMYLDIHYEPMKNSSGDITGIGIAVVDLTEQRLAEEALRVSNAESERRANELAALMDMVPAGVFLAHDPESTRITGNRLAQELLSIPHDLNMSKSAPEAEQPTTWQEMKDGVSIAPNDLPLQRAVRGEFVHDYEMDLVFSDGTVKSVMGNAIPLVAEDGKPRGGMAVLMDITNQKQAQMALKEHEEHLRLFIEHAPVSLALFDTEMRYIAASRKWMTDYGLSENNLLGHSHYEIFPQISDSWKEIHRRGLSGEAVRADEDRFERADGSVQWLRWEVLPWRGADGNIGGIIIFSEDITERKLIDDTQLFLLQCGWPSSGENFFESLARYLAETLDMDFVCIDRLSEDRQEAHTVAMYLDGKLDDNVSYTLKDTPCGDVVGKTICSFTSGVRDLFPNDTVLQDMAAEGYVGTTLWSSQGQAIGLIALISRKPLTNLQLAETVLMLTAIRAAGELEREQAEEIQRMTLQRFYNVLSSMSVLLVAENDNIEFANQSFCEMFNLNFPPHELVGLTAQQMIEMIKDAYLYPDAMISRIKELVGSDQPVIGEEIQLQNDHACIRDYVPLFVDGESHGRLWQHVDITNRRKAEQQLSVARSEAERRAAEMESFVSNLADGVSMIDMDGQILWMNDSGRAILQVPPDETFTDWMSRYRLFTLDAKPIPPDQSPGHRALRGEHVRDFRYMTVTPYGNTIILSTSASPVYDSQGQLIAATSTFRDQAERVALEKERQLVFEREQHIAEVLQGTLVPQDLPRELYGCKFAVKYLPALREAEIGGDFFDIFDLGDGKIGVIIGDVAGKGLKAAVRVAEARYTMRGYAFADLSPSHVLIRTNEVLCKSRYDEGNMLTAFFAVIDSASGIITYSGAGHEPPLVIGTDGSWTEFANSGLPIGVMGGFSYDDTIYQMQPGDRLVMITDGISEARAEGVVLFEKQGVIDYLVNNHTLDPYDIVEGLVEAATAHAGGELQDDAAIVVFSP